MHWISSDALASGWYFFVFHLLKIHLFRESILSVPFRYWFHFIRFGKYVPWHQCHFWDQFLLSVCRCFTYWYRHMKKLCETNSCKSKLLFGKLRMHSREHVKKIFTVSLMVQYLAEYFYKVLKRFHICPPEREWNRPI